MPPLRDKPIPRTVSRPIDPSKPSLLTLPAEIRNKIYGLLFTRERIIPLFKGKPYRVDDSLYTRHFVNGIRLTRSCRQIFHEAISVLYGSNTFRFSQSLLKNTQLNGAARWLSEIGIQSALLSKVIIDFDLDDYQKYPYSSCEAAESMRLVYPYSSCEAAENMAILSLLRLAWAHPRAGRALMFLPPGQKEEDNEKQEAKSGEAHCRTVTARTLKNILTSVGNDDMLELKRYAGMKRIMPAVMLWSPKQDVHGCVCFGGNFLKKFSIHDGGKRVQWVPTKSSTKDFNDLPQRIRSTIYSLALGEPEDTVFDLDSRVASGLPFHAMRVFRDLRNTVLCTDRHYQKRVSLKITTTSLLSDFDDFRVLEDWAQVRSFRELPFDSRSTDITMVFASSSRSALKYFEVDIKGLVPFLVSLREDIEVRLLRAQVRGAPHTGSEEVIVTATSLLRATFLLLSEAMSRRPQIADGPIPEIWIDGCGKLSYLRVPASTTAAEYVLDYEQSGISKDNFVVQGYDYCYSLKELVGPTVLVNTSMRYHPYARADYETTLQLWVGLRNSFWNGCR